jgi:NTE family protein
MAAKLERNNKALKNVFVFSGGGSLAAVQVGMTKALKNAGIIPDMVIGASAGALNAAFIASHPWPGSIEKLEALWLSLKRHDVFPLDMPQLVTAILGKRNYLISPSGLESIIDNNLGVQTFEQTYVGLKVVATELFTGKETVFDSGEIKSALLASAALPGIFPPVKIGEDLFIDGGVADNTPISLAANLGAKNIFVLTADTEGISKSVPSSPLGMWLHSSSLLVNKRLRLDLEIWESKRNIYVFGISSDFNVNLTDFGQTSVLIVQGQEDAEKLIKGKYNSFKKFRRIREIIDR